VDLQLSFATVYASTLGETHFAGEMMELVIVCKSAILSGFEVSGSPVRRAYVVAKSRSRSYRTESCRRKRYLPYQNAEGLAQ
jgi:hypothetical protein